MEAQFTPGKICCLSQTCEPNKEILLNGSKLPIRQCESVSQRGRRLRHTVGSGGTNKVGQLAVQSTFGNAIVPSRVQSGHGRDATVLQAGPTQVLPILMSSRSVR